jgi:hypothetical protein
MGDVLHEKVQSGAIYNDNCQLSEENEKASDGISESEFGSVLDVKQEPVPCGQAETLARNSHVSVSCAVDVITDLFDACEAAFSTFDCDLNNLVVSRSLLSLLG